MPYYITASQSVQCRYALVDLLLPRLAAHALRIQASVHECDDPACCSDVVDAYRTRRNSLPSPGLSETEIIWSTSGDGPMLQRFTVRSYSSMRRVPGGTITRAVASCL